MKYRIYMKPYCLWGTCVKSALDFYHFQYEVLDIPDGESYTDYPKVFLGDHLIGGYYDLLTHVRSRAEAMGEQKHTI